MAAPNEASSPQPLLELATAYQRSRVLLSAWDLELFTVLADEWRTSGEVAAAIGADERATDRLMNALVALGMLEKRNGRFANGALSARYLVKGRPEFMAGLGHTSNLWDAWGGLTDVVRAGQAEPQPAPRGREEEWRRRFIAAMHWRARRNAPAIVDLIDLTHVSRVLDVGGGSGAFSMAFVRARTGISAVVFDLPTVVPLTKNYVQTEGFVSEIETVAGDYLTDELPGGFDLVCLSAIVHATGAAENELLVRKSAGALDRGGRVVIQDWLMSEDRTAPLQGALFALNMLVRTAAGDTFTEAEIRGWLTRAGLQEIERKDVPSGGALLIGRKP